MKFKLIDFVTAQPAFKVILNKPLDPAIAFRLSCLIDTINDSMKKFNDIRMIQVEKYGNKNKDGGYNIPKETVEEFEKSMEKLGQEEIEVQYEPITLSDLSCMQLTPVCIHGLMPFIKVEEK